MLLQKSRKRRRSTSAASSAAGNATAGNASAAKAKPSSSAPSSAPSSPHSSSAPSSPPPPPPSPPSPPPPVFQEEEDPLFPLVDFNFVDDSLVNLYRSHWSYIRLYHRSERVQTTHNIRLTNLNTTTLHPTLWKISEINPPHSKLI